MEDDMTTRCTRPAAAPIVEITLTGDEIGPHHDLVLDVRHPRVGGADGAPVELDDALAELTGSTAPPSGPRPPRRLTGHRHPGRRCRHRGFGGATMAAMDRARRRRTPARPNHDVPRVAAMLPIR
jgi:hypothetical protein